MGRRARHALIVLACAVSAQALAAQNPPPAAPPSQPQHDSMARELLLDEMFPVGTSTITPRVTLSEGVVYRVEIQPASAQVTIRSVRQPSQPPLFMVPLEGGGAPGANQTAAFLVIPRSSEDYRFDVTDFGPEAVRLRVWTDPREMSRYARMRQATKGRPAAGLSLRAVYMGPFVRPRSSFSPPSPRGNAAASGLEACFGVVAHGTWSSGRLGGCVIAVGHLQRPDAAGALWYIGTEPEIELSPSGSVVEQAVTLTIAVASSDDLPVQSLSTDYVVFGVGYRVATRLAGRLRVEAEAGVASVHESDGFLSGVGKPQVVPRLAAGLQLRF
jgi:hypothetical protein